MSTLERMLDEFAALREPPSARRQAAAQRLRSVGLPARGEDSWRYANLRALDKVRSFRPAVAGADTGTGAAVGALPEPLPGFLRLVLVDGRLHHEPSGGAASLPGLRRSASALPELEAVSDQRLGLIATAFAAEPLELVVDAPLALEIVSLSSAATPASYVNLALRVAPGVAFRLVERHLGGGEDQGLVCIRLSLSLAEGASVQHQRLFAVSAQALLLDTLQANLAARAEYRLCQVAMGGSAARSTAEVRLQGSAASLDWQALAAGAGPQVNDTMLTVLHEAPATRSQQLFRGLSNQRAHVACNADTRVAATARGAQVTQSLRGLLDGPGAEVDLRPQLTIDTDDIQARHGATTGKLDEDLLFYLQARGLDPTAARALLKSAFLGEVLKAIEPAALRQEAERATALRLGDISLAEPWA
jgi:Fe-S cluster assembly protein SufD